MQSTRNQFRRSLQIWKNSIPSHRLFISNRSLNAKYTINQVFAPKILLFAQKRTIFKAIVDSYKKYRFEKKKQETTEQDINEALHTLPTMIREEPTLDAKLQRLDEAISSWPRDSLTHRVALEIKWSIQVAQKKFEDAKKTLQQSYSIRKEFETKRNFHLWQKSYVKLILKQADIVFKDKKSLESRQGEVSSLIDMANFVNPEDISIEVKHAELFLHLNKPKEALDILYKKEDNADANYLRIRAEAHLLSNQYEECLLYCMKTLIVSPENIKALLLKAYCYLKTKNPSSAVTALNDALHYYPKGTSAKKMRIVAYIRLGMIEDAFSDVQELLAENQSDESLLKIKSQLLRMKAKIQEEKKKKMIEEKKNQQETATGQKQPNESSSEVELQKEIENATNIEDVELSEEEVDRILGLSKNKNKNE